MYFHILQLLYSYFLISSFCTKRNNVVFTKIILPLKEGVVYWNWKWFQIWHEALFRWGVYCIDVVRIWSLISTSCTNGGVPSMTKCATSCFVYCWSSLITTLFWCKKKMPSQFLSKFRIVLIIKVGFINLLRMNIKMKNYSIQMYRSAFWKREHF